MDKLTELRLKKIEEELRWLANKSESKDLTHDIRLDLGEMADKIAQIRIPITINGKV